MRRSALPWPELAHPAHILLGVRPARSPWPLSARLVCEAHADEADELRRTITHLESLLEEHVRLQLTARDWLVQAVAALALVTRQRDAARREAARLRAERRSS